MTRPTTFAFAWFALLLVPAFAHAEPYIRQPRAHLHYDAEVDAHLVVQWMDAPGWHDDDDGFGLGVHVGIPVIDDGPVPNINNSLAVNVGLDWAHFTDSCDVAGFDAQRGCSANSFWFPATAQWNFYLSPVFSVFPELGLAIEHSRWDRGICRSNGALVPCRGSTSSTNIQPVVWLGMRVQLQDTFALTLRIGSPSVLFGASFLL